MRVFCVFHDPAVLYSFLSLFHLNKADFSHYSIRCQQSLLPGRCQKPSDAFPGLGYGMAEGLMEVGAEVVIVGSSAKAGAVADEFTKKGFLCHGVIANLADAKDRARGFEEAVEKLGNHLDILVNAAGVQRRHPSEEISNGRLSVCH